MALEPPLQSLQHFLQAVVVHGGTAEEAIAAARRAAQIQPEAVIRPSRTLSASERLGIYHGMYRLRMEEALAADYPALQHFLGAAAFTALVSDYVKAHPSRSYSLNPLGRHLPEFLLAAPGLQRRAFCHELARLELAVSEVFDEAELPPLSAAQIAAVPAAAWERARLIPIAAFRLLCLRYNVHDYLHSVHQGGHQHPPPRRRRPAWFLVYRRDFRVQRLPLRRPAYELLAALFSGAPLGQAIATACAAPRAPSESALFRWFRDWVASGVFHTIKQD
jgi:hypothetical protein